MTIYQKLINFGFTDDEICAERSTATRAVTLFRYDTPDGYPIVGLSYTCDFKAEEEYGIGDLSKAFKEAEDQTKLIGSYDNSVVFRSEKDTYFEGRVVERAEEEIDYAMGYVHYGTSRWEYEHMKMPDLRQYAKDNGIEIKGLRKKDDVITKIMDSGIVQHPNVYPAWFQDGSHLVIPKSDGLVGKILDFLIYSAQHSNSLRVGSGREAFGSGLTIFDSRDIGPKLQASIDEEQRFIDEANEKLEPVKAELKRRGHGWFYLGGPSVLAPKGKDKPETHYWLNGESRPEYGGQPFGWYTLQELLDEKWIPDQKARKY